MKNEKEIIIERNKSDGTLKSCPRCGSEKVWRIQRTEAEKIAYYLSGGNCAIKKYACQACRYTTLLHGNDTSHTQPAEVELTNNIAFAKCEKCNTGELIITELTSLQQSAYFESLGKTAFRKLKCTSCNDETIISREDYEASIRNEQ
jgi:hypothetical protein